MRRKMVTNFYEFSFYTNYSIPTTNLRLVSWNKKRHRKLSNVLVFVVTPKVTELDFDCRLYDPSLASYTLF